jgi:hypothetical protein
MARSRRNSRSSPSKERVSLAGEAMRTCPSGCSAREAAVGDLGADAGGGVEAGDAGEAGA